jgi:hypothetical protein
MISVLGKVKVKLSLCPINEASYHENAYTVKDIIPPF